MKYAHATAVPRVPPGRQPQLRMYPPFPGSVNWLPPERNREAMDDDELIAAMASGDDLQGA
jgi:hypothetical protein